MSIKIEVDRDRCVGCGICVNICPGHFELDDEGISMFKESDEECDFLEAVQSCPVEALERKDE